MVCIVSDVSEEKVSMAKKNSTRTDAIKVPFPLASNSFFFFLLIFWFLRSTATPICTLLITEHEINTDSEKNESQSSIVHFKSCQTADKITIKFSRVFFFC